MWIENTVLKDFSFVIIADLNLVEIKCNYQTLVSHTKIKKKGFIKVVNNKYSFLIYKLFKVVSNLV